ncbi:MAG: hypothetical protein ACREXJ_16660, partial [Gammaproteobacteria bacterium]
MDHLPSVRLVRRPVQLQGDRVLDGEPVRPRILDYPADVPALRRKGAQAMNVAGRAFDLIDGLKLLAGESGYSAGRVSAPGLDASPAGLVYDVRLGRHSVRFLFVETGGVPFTTAIWKPAPPRRLKPSLLKKYRRERRAFAVEAAKTFGWCLPI